MSRRDAQMRTAKRGILSALAAVAVLAVAGSATAAESYNIETILPLTGPNSFVGNEEREAFGVLEAAANRGGGVHGRSIHFAILDSQSSPQLAVQLTTQLLPSHPAVLIGDSGNSTCSAMAPILAGGPVQFCLSNGFRPVRGGNSYVIGASPDQQAAAFAKYARGRGWRRIALLNGNDATGDSAETAMLTELAKPENHDLMVVDKERFNASDISISAQLAKIRAADAQVVSTYSVGASFGVVLHGLHDAGLDVPVCASQGNLSYVEMKQFAESAVLRLRPTAGRRAARRAGAAQGDGHCLPRCVSPRGHQTRLGSRGRVGYRLGRDRRVARARPRCRTGGLARLFRRTPRLAGDSRHARLPQRDDARRRRPPRAGVGPRAGNLVDRLTKRRCAEARRIGWLDADT